MGKVHLDLEGNSHFGWPQEGSPGCGCSACRQSWYDAVDARHRFCGTARGGVNGRKVEVHAVVEVPHRQPVEGWPPFLLEPVSLTIGPGKPTDGAEVEETSISLGRWEAVRLAVALVSCAWRAKSIPPPPTAKSRPGYNPPPPPVRTEDLPPPSPNPPPKRGPT
jgi:hypothetical protein